MCPCSCLPVILERICVVYLFLLDTIIVSISFILIMLVGHQERCGAIQTLLVQFYT